MRLALTREISAALARCELTHLPRQPIDVETARRQHEAYEACLHGAGCTVVRLTADADMPDSVFIEDTALVFPELAIVTRPGAVSRRRETGAVAAALAAYRPVVQLEAPATLDGGDVLLIDRRVFVGESSRTNAAAVSQLAQLLRPHGYAVQPVPVRGCLHLKSAATAVADGAVLLNRDRVPAECFQPFAVIDVDPSEPSGGNALRAGHEVIYPAGFPRTRARLEASGLVVREVDVSELAKAEGAVTCCSLIVDVD
jgi:dimethylargininase